jgi:hypothetical protein
MAGCATLPGEGNFRDQPLPSICTGATLDPLEDALNEHAKQGWTFVEMERAHRAASLFFLLVFRKD